MCRISRICVVVPVPCKLVACEGVSVACVAIVYGKMKSNYTIAVRSIGVDVCWRDCWCMGIGIAPPSIRIALNCTGVSSVVVVHCKVEGIYLYAIIGIGMWVSIAS